VGQVAIGYRTLDLGGLAQKLQDHAAAGLITLRFGSDIETIPNGFDLIIDTRNQAPPASGSGVQQFMGKVIHLNRPHGIDLPVIMDATVEQQGGFCFVYLLPLSTTEILVEDTRLLGAPQPWTNFEAGLSHYLECKGWTGSILHTSHHESGQIPIPVVRLNQWQTASNGDMADIGPKRQSTSSSGTPLVLRAGAAAGYFHPTTGYSLPCALSSCLAIKEFVTDWSAAMEANRSKLTQECIPLNQLRSRAPAKMKIDQEHEAFWDAALLFNRFLLWGFRSDEAFHAFVYFYRLPLPFIKRFYGGGLRKRDWTTLMTRMPPERFKGISFLRQWLRLWLRLRSTTH
jgi:lycopene beta-cyclase